MNKIELLNLKLDCGEVVIFQDKNTNDFIAIGGAGKDKDGDYRHSSLHNTIEEVKQNIGRNVGLTKVFLEQNLPNWKYIDSYAHAYGERPQIGDKVLILPNAKEMCKKNGFSWNKHREEMVGKVYEVESYNSSDYEILNEDKSDYWFYPREAFVIAWEEEEEIQEMTVEQISKLVGKKVKIIQ